MATTDHWKHRENKTKQVLPRSSLTPQEFFLFFDALMSWYAFSNISQQFAILTLSMFVCPPTTWLKHGLLFRMTARDLSCPGWQSVVFVVGVFSFLQLLRFLLVPVSLVWLDSMLQKAKCQFELVMGMRFEVKVLGGKINSYWV